MASAFATAALPTSFAAVNYEVRAMTGDNVRAAAYAPKQKKYVYGIRRQGSFGAPAINDKDIVAYPCTIAGAGLDAFHNTALILKEPKRAARIGVQSGFRLNNNFMAAPGVNERNVANSATIWQLGQNVGLNKQGRMAFSARILFVRDHLNDKGESNGTTGEETAVYGTVVPSGNKFKNSSVSTYLRYFEQILTVPVSFNAQGAVAYNADFYVTSEKSVAGFAFGTIKTESGLEPGVIATVESNVIGLPYFTIFTTFSRSVIADKNVGFVVAGLSDGGSNFDGIWQGSNPNLQPVVVKMTAAPGGGKFASFGEVPGPSRNGAYCAFTATVSGGKISNGVFRSNKKGDDVRLIANTGASAPGLGNGKSSPTFNRFESAVSSNLGHVAVVATTYGASGEEVKGIWLTNAEGKNLTLLAATGQTLTVGKKQKTIASLMVNPIGCINRNGDVAFTASFNDRTSAVIVAKAGL